MPQPDAFPRGRGSVSNPPNRFERLRYDVSELPPDERPAPRTQFLRDDSRTVIVKANDGRSLNPYRGCEHGCAYPPAAAHAESP